MLRKIRIIFAVFFITMITLLFLDFTGTWHHWFGWMAKIQFLPAVLSVNALVLGALIIATLLFGRIYCSIICPLGVFQDLIAWIAGKRKKNRYQFSAAKKILRYSLLVLFIVTLVAGVNAFYALLAPYSAYGRMVSALLAPIYQWGNNVLAYLAKRAESYQFYPIDIWMKSISIVVVAIVTFIIIVVLAWKNGRTYCNTICPVGTILGFFAKYSWFKPVIDTTKCNSCGLCSKNCKASCINSKEHQIDYSRCVACMDCLEKCKKDAIHYTHASKVSQSSNTSNKGRRSFLTGATLLAVSSVVKAQQKKVDGGLAVIQDKKIPKRQTPITPAGSLSAKHLQQHCTACQLCISACPNEVLRPSSDLTHFMQPEISYERGYCRPECTKCADVCPTSAIKPITLAEKSSIQIGHAVWIKKNCIVITDDVKCGNCSRHCPTGAIEMIPLDANNPNSPKIPSINVEKCIGCGACENLCPARPFSAIYVEGHEVHRTI